jgi:hypothetical protein
MWAFCFRLDGDAQRLGVVYYKRDRGTNARLASCYAQSASRPFCAMA